MKIYVVTHENMTAELPEGYELFKVGGADGTTLPNDSTGDNISVKNPYYCELTAAYWIWKNDKTSDIVGLMHYRRFLTTKPERQREYISESEVRGLLENCDFIATPLFRNRPSVKQVMFDGVRESDYLLLRSVVGEKYPEMLDVFDEVFDGQYTYFCNICVTRLAEWDKYCEWLFGVLFELEKRVDMTGYSAKEKRLYGYLSERLFTVYTKFFKKRVTSVRLIAPKKPFLTRVRNKLKKIFGI